MAAGSDSQVIVAADIGFDVIASFLRQFNLKLVVHGDDEPITGSFWGAPEAGIVGEVVYLRNDTPVHSLLHESCHIICMPRERRQRLRGDAGGDDLEESAVCYLQLVLANHIDGVSRERLMHDMDAWGYSFRLGSARAWFEQDAEDAREFLINQRLLTELGEPTFAKRL